MEETLLLNLEVDVEASIQSIDSLTKANKELRKERNALNLQSEQGKKRGAEINALLDQNTEKIKTNVSALEKQKLNIGNYKSALDNIIPGLGGFLDKTVQGTKAVQGLTVAQRILLGPIGLIIIALTAIIKYLTGSEEGMDKLAVVMAKVSAVIDVVADRLIKLGGGLVKLLSGDFSGGIDDISNSFSGMGDEIQREVELATDLAERLDILDDLNLALRIRLSEQGNEIKNLIIQSKNRSLSEEDRMKKLVEAAELEKRLTGERIALRIAEINAIATEIQMRNSDKEAAQKEGETSIQFAKRLAANNKVLLSDREKIAEQLEQYNGLLDNQANIQEKIQNQQDVISDKIIENTKKQNEAFKEQQALKEADRRADNNPDIKNPDLTGDPFLAQIKSRGEQAAIFEKRFSKEKEKRDKEDVDRQKKYEEDVTKFKEDEQRTRLQQLHASTQDAAAVFGEQSAAYKAGASVETLIATYASAQKAFDALAGIPIVGPALGAAAAALAITAGLARVAAINNIQFAEGGYTGPGPKLKPAGVVHAGEVVWSQQDVAKVGGPARANAMRPTAQGYADGGFVTNQNISSTQQALIMANAVKNLPQPVVSWSEGRAVGRRIEAREKVARI